jgi:hypothetical protein
MTLVTQRKDAGSQDDRTLRSEITGYRHANFPTDVDQRKPASMATSVIRLTYVELLAPIHA